MTKYIQKLMDNNTLKVKKKTKPKNNLLNDVIFLVNLTKVKLDVQYVAEMKKICINM